MPYIIENAWKSVKMPKKNVETPKISTAPKTRSNIFADFARFSVSEHPPCHKSRLSAGGGLALCKTFTPSSSLSSLTSLSLYLSLYLSLSSYAKNFYCKLFLIVLNCLHDEWRKEAADDLPENRFHWAGAKLVGTVSPNWGGSPWPASTTCRKSQVFAANFPET